MTDETAARLPARQSTLELSFDLFLRLVALSCLVYGTAYWVRLIGFFEGAEWRFDLMPFYWQMTAVPLAVLFPFAAVGLWMMASWGPVVWVLCAGLEMVMYGLFPNSFGRWPLIVGLHAAVATAYIVLRAMLYLQARRTGH